MSSFRCRGSGLMQCLALLGLCLAGLAAKATPPALAMTDAQRSGWVHRWAVEVQARHFDIPDGEMLDADLRRHGEAIASEAMVILRKLGADWLARGGPADGLNEADTDWLMQHGLLGALARMHLARHRRDDAAGWLPALELPRLCQQGAPSPWVLHLRMLQQLSGAARQSALRADRQSLSALGDPAWRPPARPTPTLFETVPAWLAEQRAGRGDTAGVAMVPRLGHVLFAEDSLAEPLRWTDRCLLAQWWVRDRLRRGALDAHGALLAFRYATLLQPQDQLRPPVSKLGGYPPVAARFGVEADVVVAWSYDALGHTTQARITSRRLRVPQAPPGSTLPWEEHFDLAALAAIAARPPERTASGADPARRDSATLNFKLSQ